jgi:hypothetical protein
MHHSFGKYLNAWLIQGCVYFRLHLNFGKRWKVHVVTEIHFCFVIINFTHRSSLYSCRRLVHHAELTLFQELANYSQCPEGPVVETDSKYGHVISVMRSWWCELILVIEKSRKRQESVIFCEVLRNPQFPVTT